MTDRTITLTGHDLTIEQLIDIARHGAKVVVSAAAMQRAADSFGLMLEAQHEGVAVYRFNRQAGSGREIPSMTGDPDTPENKAILAARHDARTDKIGQGSPWPTPSLRMASRRIRESATLTRCRC